MCRWISRVIRSRNPNTRISRIYIGGDPDTWKITHTKFPVVVPGVYWDVLDLYARQWPSKDPRCKLPKIICLGRLIVILRNAYTAAHSFVSLVHNNRWIVDYNNKKKKCTIFIHFTPNLHGCLYICIRMRMEYICHVNTVVRADISFHYICATAKRIIGNGLWKIQKVSNSLLWKCTQIYPANVNIRILKYAM